MLQEFEFYLLRERMSHLAKEGKIMRFFFHVQRMADLLVILTQLQRPHSHLFAELLGRLNHRNNIHGDTLHNMEHRNSARRVQVVEMAAVAVAVVLRIHVLSHDPSTERFLLVLSQLTKML